MVASKQRTFSPILNAHPRVQALSSHQIHYPVPAARGFIFFDICFLRDPMDRLRSTYDYFRQRPSAGDPLSDAANGLQFAEFFRCLLERFPEQVDNPQVNLLANGAADRETVPEDLAPAIRRMIQTSFLGVVDCFDQSMIAGQARLGIVFPALDCSYQPANVSRGLDGTMASRRAQFREACGRTVYAELLRRNALDHRLVRAARAEVRRRFAVRERPVLIGEWLRALPRIWKVRRLFDAAFYLERYPDVRQSGMNPLLHYVRHGAAEGRKPHRLFEPDYYLSCCPAAREYRRTRCFTLLRPGAVLAIRIRCSIARLTWRQHPEVAARGMNPLLHYVGHAWRAKAPAPPNAALLTILDVEVAVAFWEDESGRMQFMAEPQQQPFFRAMRFDQLSAQINP